MRKTKEQKGITLIALIITIVVLLILAGVAIGTLECLSIFGNDYDTPDGTGVRDYIHVVDLADAHVKSVEKIATKQGVLTYNVGTGNGYSVLEMVKAFGKACGHDIKYKIIDRRPGDIAVCYADPKKSKDELGFEAKKTLEDMCNDTWKWQSLNKNGFKSKFVF